MPSSVLLGALLLGAGFPSPGFGSEPGPPYGNDDGYCGISNACTSWADARICSLGAGSPNTLDSWASTSIGASIAQGQTFTTQTVNCQIVRWRVDVTTRTPHVIGRAYDGTTYPNSPPSYQARVPECQPLGEAWATVLGWGQYDSTSNPPTHWRNSKTFTITAGSQACVYSAGVNPAQLLQGDQQVVYWSAPNNQASARAYLYTSGGSVVNMTPYGGGSDGYFGGVTNATQQFQWQIPPTLPPGSYFAKVKAFNGSGQSKEASTPTITVGPRPTVGSVQVAPTTVYAGNDLNVSWSSSYQSSWKLYLCDSAGQDCGSPVLTDSTSATQTTWTTPLGPTGTFKLKVEVTNSGSGASASALSGLVTIQPRPTITVQWSAPAANVGESGTTAPSVVVTTSNAQATLNQVVVNFQTEDITAVAGVDYSYKQGQIVVPAGTANGSSALAIPVPILIGVDVLDESNEQFRVRLTGVSGTAGQLGAQQAHVVTIVDDDEAKLSVQGVTIGEGGTAQVLVSLSNPSVSAVSVAFATVPNGGAQAGLDYQHTSGSLNWAAQNNATRSVPVATLPDDVFEGNETLLLRLSAAQNATIQTGDGVVTITDDDSAPTLSIEPATLVEGDSGTTAVSVVLSLNHATVQPVTGNFATADGTARAGLDYVQASGPFSLAPLETSKLVPLSVLGDLLDEDVESFDVSLSGVVNAQAPSLPAHVTIFDNDPLPELSLSDVSVPEGDSGTSAAAFTLTLGAASGRNVRVSYKTGLGSALAGSDYMAVSGDVLLKPGETSYSVPVAVLGDRRHESDETVTLNLRWPQNAVLSDDSATALIVDDDDDQPALNDPTTTERSSVAFEVTGPESGPITVDFETQDGSALAGQDYVSRVGTLTLEPGLPVSVKVDLLADALPEQPETFALVLKEPGTGVELARGTATLFDAPIAGDFNADGEADLVWRKSDGSIEAWLMAGLARLSAEPTSPGSAPSNWDVVGTADFNADGRSDLLWLNNDTSKILVWFMNGVVATGSAPTNPDQAAASNWKVAGTGDFNHDSQADILWRNTSTGKTVVWQMNGVARSAGSFTTPDGVGDVSWVVQGVGDFDGNGQPDLLWRHALSGRTVIWMMDGLVRVSGSFTAPVGENDLNWEIGAIADYTADGRADIIWRDRTSGVLRVWSMDGTLRLENLALSPDSQPDLAWVLEGPR